MILFLLFFFFRMSVFLNFFPSSPVSHARALQSLTWCHMLHDFFNIAFVIVVTDCARVCVCVIYVGVAPELLVILDKRRSTITNNQLEVYNMHNLFLRIFLTSASQEKVIFASSNMNQF